MCVYRQVLIELGVIENIAVESTIPEIINEKNMVYGFNISLIQGILCLFIH